MRLLICTSWGGTYPIAFLDQLLASDAHDVIQILSQGAKTSTLSTLTQLDNRCYINPIQDYLRRRGLDSLYSELSSLNAPDSLDLIHSLKPDRIIFIGYGEILSYSFLRAFQSIALNIHPGILPQNKGADPISFALLHEGIPLGVTIHRFSLEIDSGDILGSRVVDLKTLGLSRTRFACEWQIGLGAASLLEAILLSSCPDALLDSDDQDFACRPKAKPIAFTFSLDMHWNQIDEIFKASDHLFLACNLNVMGVSIHVLNLYCLARNVTGYTPGVLAVGNGYVICACADSVFSAHYHSSLDKCLAPICDNSDVYLNPSRDQDSAHP